MLRPDIQWKNPVMFVVEVGTVLTLIYTIAKLFGYQSAASRRLSAGPGFLARGDPALCQLRLGHCGGPRQGPGRCPAEDAAGHAGPAACATTEPSKQTVSTDLRAGDQVEVDRRRGDPQRRRDHRGRGLHRRIGHHRRVGPRDPRGRRRPLRRHRRHAGPFRPDRRRRSPPAPAVPFSTA